MSTSEANKDQPRPQSSALNQDFVRQQVKKQEEHNFHSSSLKSSQTTMVAGSSVNKTALHPGGVQYVALIPLKTSKSWLTLDSSVGPSPSTQRSRKTSMQGHISTMTESPLYVAHSYTECSRLILVTDRQPVRRGPLRRCPCLRIWFRNHILRRPISIFRSEDRSIAVRQANRERGRFTVRGLVGPCEQTHGSKGEHTTAFVVPRFCIRIVARRHAPLCRRYRGYNR